MMPLLAHPAAPAVLSWSGGKDSALALYHAQRDPRYQMTHLLTNVSTPHGRVAMHGVRPELLAAQAERLGLPLRQLRLPDMPAPALYDQAQQAMLASLRTDGVRTAIYGDIFLEDLRAYREQQLARAGLRGAFPLWQRASADVVREVLDLGFQAIIVCVNERYLDASFCGRLLSRDLLRDLPPGVDPCGENGEYHSFVVDAPNFSRPIALAVGELTRRTYAPPTARPAGTSADPFAAGFWYCDAQLIAEAG